MKIIIYRLALSLFFVSIAGVQASSDKNASKNTEYGIEHYGLLPKEGQQILKDCGWCKAPSAGDIAKALAWLGGSVGAMRYLKTVLQRDKRARMLKLQRQEQEGGAVNPIAQMMRAFQMQSGEMEASGDQSPLVAAEPVKQEQLEWIPDDILPQGKRKFFQVLSWIATGLSILSAVNVADKLKDYYQGNTVPSVVRNHINWFAKVDGKFAQKRLLAEKHPMLAPAIAYDLLKEYDLDITTSAAEDAVTEKDDILKVIDAGRNKKMLHILKGAQAVAQSDSVKWATKSGLTAAGAVAYKWHDLEERGKSA